MRPRTSTATIEFMELRFATRAMNTHSRDPLRLGGRPLQLAYTLSRPSTCLWLADLPPSLANLPEMDLFATFSRIVPVEQVRLFWLSYAAARLG